MSKYHIRYGGYGGIGYYLVSDNYIALMSRFTTCGGKVSTWGQPGLLNGNSNIIPGFTDLEGILLFVPLERGARSPSFQSPPLRQHNGFTWGLPVPTATVTRWRQAQLNTARTVGLTGAISPTEFSS